MRYKFHIIEHTTYEVDIEADVDASDGYKRDLARRTLGSTPALERLDLVVQLQDGEITEVPVCRWSESQVEAASHQGWTIASHDDGSYHIERRDDRTTPLFKTDAAASHWVRYKAEEGSTLHLDALAYIDLMSREA